MSRNHINKTNENNVECCWNKVDEADSVSFLNQPPICGSWSVVQSLQFGGWVILGNLAPTMMMMFGLVTLTKNQTTPTILRNKECYPPSYGTLHFHA